MKRVFVRTFSGATRLLGRIRSAIETVYRLDERLEEWMQASRAFTLSVIGVVWLCLAIVVAVTWMVPTSRHRLEVVAFFALASGGLFLLGRYRLRQQLLQQWRKPGLCHNCGYDLRATPSRCPECGMKATSPAVDQLAVNGRLPAIQTIRMDHTLFNRTSVICLILCLIAGIAYIATAQVTMYDPTPDLRFQTVSWLGWASIFFAVMTAVLLSRRMSEIRRTDDRLRRGLCPDCGYDLCATPGRCPECGQGNPDSPLRHEGDFDSPRIAARNH